MRFVEIECPDCGEMKITFNLEMPAYVISCPLCGNDVKIIKINGEDING